MFSPGMPEPAITMFLILGIFGVGKLPGIRGAIGKKIKSFKRAVTELDESSPSKKGRMKKEKRYEPLPIHDVKHSPAKQTDRLRGNLPHNDPERGQVCTAVKEFLPTGRERILFVDDDDTVAELNQLRLSRLGYEVVATTSSADALEIFQKEPDAFDLVCIDYVMPDLTGTELAAELLKAKPTIPIILCSGYLGEISPEDIRKMGIRAFLLKPPGKYEIAEAIRRVLDAEFKKGGVLSRPKL
jgi:CheY-like chemotaxis protein